MHGLKNFIPLLCVFLHTKYECSSHRNMHAEEKLQMFVVFTMGNEYDDQLSSEKIEGTLGDDDCAKEFSTKNVTIIKMVQAIHALALAL